jgi:CHAD domain-containing protein
VKAKRVKKLDPSAPLAENAARIVRVRLRELRGFAPRALKPKKARVQHDMRIAAKRLRYVLEATEMCFGSAGPAARRAARDVQGVLGDLHDCDVMLPRAERHLEELHAIDAAIAYAGMEVLIAHLRGRREELFARFTELWAELEEGGVWDSLERSATGVRRRGEERRRAAEAGQAASGALP